MQPLIAITTDVLIHSDRERCATSPLYAHAVTCAGGIPVLLSHECERLHDLLDRIDAVIFTGGDDPRTEAFGHATDPRATPLHPDRQQFEIALLRAIDEHRPDLPVLGICLGMQLMALVAGGRLDQYMPDSCPTAAEHWNHAHQVFAEPAWYAKIAAGVHSGETRSLGNVQSHHKQAVADPGRLAILARAPDNIIEAVADPARPFYLGVQWHPERTDNPATGDTIFQALIAAATKSSKTPATGSA